MSDLSKNSPKGVLRNGWNATVGDYAIAGGWACKGNSLVVGDSAGGVFSFAAKSGAVLWKRLENHVGGLLAMDISPNGLLIATAGQDGCVLIWNAQDGQILQKIELGQGWVDNIAWSPDGTRLAASISGYVHVYDVNGKEAWRSQKQPSTISALAWSSPEELATACYGRVSFFNAISGELGEKLEWKGSLVSLVLSSDGNIVACGSQDNSVHFWRRSTGQDSQMQGYPGKPSALAFDRTNTLLATSGGRAVTVWSFQGNGPEGTSPSSLELHVRPITTLAFSMRGRRLASGGRDGGVAIWSLKENGEGGVVGAAIVSDVIANLAWRPDDRALAALDSGGGVTVWRVGGA